MDTTFVARSLGLLSIVAALSACDAKSGVPASPGSAASTTAPASTVDLGGLAYPAPKRLVAFGDVHGDLDATKRALVLAGATDASGAWVGGDLFVVQTGDGIDRGDADRDILDLFDRLRDEAKAKGGTFLALNGNHEVMNAELDFRYVTDGAMRAFDDFAAEPRAGVPSSDASQRGRTNAFFPGGTYAKRLAERPIVAVVGDTVLVHGGVLKKHLAYGLPKMDGELRGWLRGERPVPRIVVSEDGPIWARHYSAQPGARECSELGEVLGALGAKRMVMGHTPQKPDISPACDGRAWRIDTGMAKYYGGNIEVLEVVGDDVKVLKE